MNRKRAILAGLLIAAAAVAFLLAKPRHEPHQNLPISFWYFHSPYRLTAQESNQLKEMNVKLLFVRGGTFTTDGKSALLRLPQEYGSPAPALPVHLTFPFDGGFVRHLEEFDEKQVARQIQVRLLERVRLAEEVGIKVAGVQLDLDCPTRLLLKYARIAALIRPSIREKGLELSATGLTSWLGTEGVRALSRELDFLVPQFYEGQTGMKLSEFRPIFDPEEMRRQLPKAEGLACPYWVGIPAYGHALLYDQRGQLSQMLRNLPPSEALRHPSFRLLESYPANRLGKPAQEDWIGEQVLQLSAIRPAKDGRGLGSTLVYSIPTPEVVRQALQLARDAGPGCLGAIVYRVQDEDDELVVPLSELARVVAGKPPISPQVTITQQWQQASFDAIEGKSKSPVPEVTLHVVNEAGWTRYGSGVVIDLDLGAGVEAAISGPIQRVEFLDRNDEVCVPHRSEKLRIALPVLKPKETVEIGPIRLLKPPVRHAKISYRTYRPDGGVAR